MLALLATLAASPASCLGSVTDGGECRVLETRSVEGEVLEPCSKDPLTGFYRDGYCVTGPEDRGTHVVCAEMTEAFLRFTQSKGNDLSTPHPRYRFPGLKPGDRWCLCALRWREADRAGVAPPVILSATEASAERFVKRETLRRSRKR